MGRAPCCEKIGLRRGRWTAEEDQLLSDYIQAHGEGSWRSLPKNAGLLRCGKSCRLRWINYLRSDVKRGNISSEEEDTIVKLHAKLGNRWSLIAGHLSGRTDNEIKNYWNSHLSRKISPSSASPKILTKRRSSAMKIKKPRKTTTTIVPPLSENQRSTINPGAGGGAEADGEVILAESSTSVGEKEKELDDFFDDEGLLMDMEAAASVSVVLNEQEDVVVNNNNNNTINSASSSSTDDDSNQQQGGKQDNLEWEWESCDWDFEGVNSSMLIVDGIEGDDDIMSWPWESESPTQPVGLDVEKQEAFIAWLLS